LAVKKRDPIFVVVVSLVTCGLYALYWFYHTTRELGEANKSETNPLVWTIGLFIPFVNLYFLWKYSGESEKIMKGKHSQLLIFIAWLVFFPIAQYLVQQELNKVATV
jgi:uncharacterized membrane protein